MGCQYGLKENIVNVPIDVNETEKILPRKITNASVVHLALMRKLQYKHPYLFETIRPDKVYNACKYLVSTPVYQDEEIQLSEEWKSITCPIYFEESEPLNLPQEEDEQMDSDKSESETEEESNTASSSYPEQTMLLDESDFLTTCVKHAPGEGRRPISLLWDLNGEVLTFPTIYCGQKRNVNPKLTYTDIAKSEALNADRRACVPHKLLYSFKKSQQQQVVDSITISLRKRANIQNVTAGNLLDPEYVTGLEHRNEGYKILKNIRSSPAYWEARKKELFATIRQLGIPTFFHTVSAMEIHWPELIVILKQILDGDTITAEQAGALDQIEKTNLIRRDPITCARYFDAKTQDYFNILLKTKAVFTNHPLEDFFLRVEFQHRGSPHLHIFLWMKNAPTFDVEDPGYCVPFIDEYITTKRTELSLQFQQHRHTQCCRRLVNGVHVCRFGIPYPPMKRTEILTPLAQDYPEGERVLLKNELAKIKLLLRNLHKHDDIHISFDEFVKQTSLTETKYILAIRSNIRRPTVFLKRDVDAAFINGYNDKLLRAWRSNMDLQFVLDPYACARYLSEYISKSYRGMSSLLRDAVSELQRGNMSLKNKLKSLGSLFVNKSEVSAQEAAYGILGLQLSKFSRDHVYINTGVPDERSRLTKSAEELKNMNPDDTDVLMDGLIEHYVKRSEQLENLCLADYAAWYNFKKTKASEKAVTTQQKVFRQKDGNGCVKKRSFAKVIRSRRYGQVKEPFMYYRENVMLFHPWRDEELEVNSNPMAIYRTHSESIQLKGAEYNKMCNEINIEDVLNELHAEEKDSDTQELDEENSGVGPTDENIFDDKTETSKQKFLLPGVLPQHEYASLMDCLNAKQKNYLLHVVHAIKSKTQIMEYLGGGAGVGKSTTIRAIVQALTRYYLTQAGNTPDLLRVLLCAPTGIAAYNIEGKTLHSTFVLPFNQSKYDGNQLRTLDPDTRTRITSNLLGVKLIICDELSMISNRQLSFINQRLQEFFRSKELFGGHSIIFVGDLWQLPPIGGSHIFAPIRDDISSLACSSIWDNVRYYELDEVMRQQGDPTFAQALNRMKIGAMTKDDILLLKSREISAFNQPPDNVVWLFHFREKVRQHNTVALENCQEEEVRAVAVDKIEGKGDLDEKGKTKLLCEAKGLNYQDAQGLPYELVLKKSIRYMVTANIHSDLANGAIGTLQHVSMKTISGVMVPTIVWIKFPEPRTGAQAREAYSGPKLKSIDPSWTPISIESKPVKCWEGRQVRVVRSQFPLAPAEAITIYKSQSQTFTEMVLTTHPGITRSLLYVGCSRARSSDGLWINGTFEPPSPVNSTNRVYQAYEELRLRPVLLSHLPNPAPNESMISLVFYNIQHYNPHKKDLETIITTLKPNIIALVETHSWPNQELKIHDYHLKQRTDLAVHRKSGYGTACFSTVTENKRSTSLLINGKDGHVQLTTLFFPTFIIVYGYSTPKTSYSELEFAIKSILENHSLSSISTVLVGDFNKDLNTVAGQKLGKFMKSIGMPSCLPIICSTTRCGTQIDCVFSGIPGIEAYISTSLTSHHDPIQIFIPALKNQSVNDAILQDLINLNISAHTENYTVSSQALHCDRPTTVHQSSNELGLNSSQQSTEISTSSLRTSQFMPGLLNPTGKNLCFANSTIQALRPIFNVLDNPNLTEHCLYTNLLQLYQDMIQSPKPQLITQLLALMTTSEFQNGQQHDVSEFLDKLLDQLHEDTIMYSAQEDLIESTFRIVLSDNEQGVACSHRKREDRSLWSLPLPLNVTGAEEDINNLLCNFLKKSQSVPKSCESCQMQHTMLENFKYEVLPRVLILQLGRFLPNGDKANKFIGIPDNLKIKVKTIQHSYQLQAVVNHSGTSQQGHYVAMTRNNDSWMKWDDERGTRISATQVITYEAYIIFYIKN